MTNNFGQWGMENIDIDFAKKYWGTKNEDSPFDYTTGSDKKVWIKCQEKDYHEEYLTRCSRFKAGHRCPYCAKSSGVLHPKDSFAQWCIDNVDSDFMDKYWSKNNKLNPYELSPYTTKNVLIKCQEKDYHDDYLIKGLAFTGGSRCSYCASKKVHPKDSFGQLLVDTFGEEAIEKHWGKENKLNPFEISSKNNRKIKLNCTNTDYHGQYTTSCNDFFHGFGCTFCSSNQVHELDSIGNLFDMEKVWSDKNKLNPYKLSAKSNKKAWWKCTNKKHKDFYRTVYYSTSLDFRCPECVKEMDFSLNQKKTFDYISSRNYKINTEYKCTIIPKNPKTKQRLPFDNEIEELKLIVEVHGQQHYILQSKSSSWIGNKTPEEFLHYRKLLDRYKKFIAYKNGYYYLELPYWAFEDDTYKELIDNKIKEITKIM